MNIKTTTVTQTGNEVLGTKEKKLYYLIIENILGNKTVINVGEKTHDKVLELITREEAIVNAEEEAKKSPELPLTGKYDVGDPFNVENNPQEGEKNTQRRK